MYNLEKYKKYYNVFQVNFMNIVINIDISLTLPGFQEHTNNYLYFKNLKN